MQEKYLNKSINSHLFKEFLKQYLQENLPKEKVDKIYENISINDWISMPGYPINKINSSSILYKNAKSLSNSWIKEEDILHSFESFSFTQKLIFLDNLLASTEMNHERFLAIEKEYNLSSAKNNEILFRWIRIGIRNNDESSFQLAENFLKNNSRIKFVRPIFREIFKKRKEIALDFFKKYKEIYPLFVSKLIEEDFKFY